MPHHANSGSFKKGLIPWSTGKHLPESTKRKIKLKALEPERVAQSIAHLPPSGKGSENPHWKGGLKTKKCLCCGEEFQVIPAFFDRAKYCSELCQHRSNGEQHRGPNNHNWHGGRCISLTCEYCGRQFWVIPSMAKTRHCCSYACNAKAKGTFRRLNTDPEFQRKRLTMRTPNRQERKLAALLKKWFHGEWKFVGNGEVILGALNPDFINCNGKKQIIEFFGCWYHGCPIHCPDKKVNWQDTEIGKKVIYSRYGFETLVIWEHELADEKATVDKVLCFKEV